MPPAPLAVRTADVEADIFAPIDPAEPTVVVRLAVAAVSVPDDAMLPFAVSVKTLPLEAPRLTEPLSVKVTLPEVFALTVLALV